MPVTNELEHHEGTCEVCAHHIEYRYWGIEIELDATQREWLDQEAEERAECCIKEGCHSGQLVCELTEPRSREDGYTCYGGWEIVRN